MFDLLRFELTNIMVGKCQINGVYVFKSNLNKIDLLIKLTLGTFLVTPHLASALTIIDASNIGTHTNSGIAVSSTEDIIIQNITGVAAPHINITGNQDYGIKSGYNGKTLTIDTGTDEFVIQTNATGNYNKVSNIHVLSGGKVNALSDIRLNVKDGTGIYFANTGKADFDKKVTIIGTGTSNGSFIGIRAYNGSNSSKTEGNFNGEVNIQSVGNGSYGILSLLNNAPDSLGINLNFNEKVTINMSGTNSTGVAFQEYAGANPNADSVIKFNNGLDLTTANGTAVSIDQKAGKLFINSGSNVNNIVSTSYNNYNAIQSTAGEITVNGKSNIKGDIYAASSGQINLDLTDGSTLLTSIDNTSSSANKGTINVKIDGSQSQWNMTNSSSVDSLTLTNYAKVSFGHDYATSNTILDGSNNMTLKANSLSGNGLFELRTSIGSGFANDLLKITGSSQATGNHNISIRDDNNGSAAVTGNEKITLVETEGGGANFNLASASVDIGAYQFNTLTKVTDERNSGSEDWVLSAQKKTVNPTKPNLTNTAQNAANILNSSYLISYIETQTLMQRMGKLRQGETSDGDAWGRIYGGKLSSFNDKRLSNFDMDYYGLQLGVDRKVENTNGDIYYGIMGGLSRGNIDHHVGDGNTKGYYAALYGTYLNQSGFYIDGLIKYMRMSNKFNTRTGAGYFVKGDGDTNGFSIGTELGQRFYFNSLPNQGWYFEPQAQLTYSHQGSAVINATNGLRTKLDSYNSLLGRASIVLGNSFTQDDNIVDVYLKTGYVKEFDGETSYVFNHVAKEKYDFGGNWWDNGIGVDIQFNKQHHIYTDVVYSFGNKFDQKQVNLGYRYSF